MEEIIDSSSDSINTFLNGFLLSKQSREQLTHAFMKSYRFEENQKWRYQTENPRKQAGDRLVREKAIKHTSKDNLFGINKIKSARSNRSQKRKQECVSDVGYVESPSFPELVGAWSGSSISKSLSQSSCMVSGKEKAEITLSLSSDNIQNVPKEPSDTTLAIRKRLNLLSIITPIPVTPTSTEGHHHSAKRKNSTSNLQSSLTTVPGSDSHSKSSTNECMSPHGKSKRRRRVRRTLKNVLESESSLLSLAIDSIISSKQQATVKTSTLSTYPKTKLGKSPICHAQERGFRGKAFEDGGACLDVNDWKKSMFSGMWKHSDNARVDAITQVDSGVPIVDQKKCCTRGSTSGNSFKEASSASDASTPSLQKCSQNNSSRSISQSRSTDTSDDKLKGWLPKATMEYYRNESLAEATASAEQIYKDLRANSTGRVKVSLLFFKHM